MGGRKCCVLPIQLQLMAMQCKIVISDGSRELYPKIGFHGSSLKNQLERWFFSVFSLQYFCHYLMIFWSSAPPLSMCSTSKGHQICILKKWKKSSLKLCSTHYSGFGYPDPSLTTVMRLEILLVSICIMHVCGAY